MASLLIAKVFLITSSVERISNVKKSSKNKIVLKNTCVFTQIHPLSVFCPISLSISLLLYVWVCVLSEPFESKLYILGPFTPTNFSMYFIRIKIFFYITPTFNNVSKFNIDTILLYSIWQLGL